MLEGNRLIADFASEAGTRLEAYGRIVKAICLVVGPVFLGLALVFAIGTIRFLQRSVSASGTIVQLIPVITDREDNSVTYSPVFRFVARDGHPYEVRSDSGTNPPRYRVGNTAPVLYNPANPADAKLHDFFSLWGMALVFAILGGLASGVGLSLRRYEKWLNRRGLSITPVNSESPAG